MYIANNARNAKNSILAQTVHTHIAEDFSFQTKQNIIDAFKKKPSKLLQMGIIYLAKKNNPKDIINEVNTIINNGITDKQLPVLQKYINMRIFEKLAKSIQMTDSIEDREKQIQFFDIIDTFAQKKRADRDFFRDIFAKYYIYNYSGEELIAYIAKKYNGIIKTKQGLHYYFSAFADFAFVF